MVDLGTSPYMLNRYHCFYALTIEILNLLCGIVMFVRNIVIMYCNKRVNMTRLNISVKTIYTLSIFVTGLI